MEGQLVRVLGLTVSTTTQVSLRGALERVDQDPRPTVAATALRAKVAPGTLEPGQLSHRGFEFATPETI